MYHTALEFPEAAAAVEVRSDYNFRGRVDRPRSAQTGASVEARVSRMPSVSEHHEEGEVQVGEEDSVVEIRVGHLPDLIEGEEDATDDELACMSYGDDGDGSRTHAQVRYEGPNESTDSGRVDDGEGRDGREGNHLRDERHRQMDGSDLRVSGIDECLVAVIVGLTDELDRHVELR